MRPPACPNWLLVFFVRGASVTVKRNVTRSVTLRDCRGGADGRVTASGSGSEHQLPAFGCWMQQVALDHQLPETLGFPGRQRYHEVGEEGFTERHDYRLHANQGRANKVMQVAPRHALSLLLRPCLHIRIPRPLFAVKDWLEHSFIWCAECNRQTRADVRVLHLEAHRARAPAHRIVLNAKLHCAEPLHEMPDMVHAARHRDVGFETRDKTGLTHRG